MTKRKEVANAIDAVDSRVVVVNREQLLEMIEDAVADSFGGQQTPRLYRLIELYRSGHRPDGVREQIVDSCVALINNDLVTFDRAHAFFLLELMTETELLNNSDRIRIAVCAYIDPRMHDPDIGTLDMAAALLSSPDAPAKTYAEKWLPHLRARMASAPSWIVMDVLAEVMGLVAHEQYPEQQFLDDLRLLLTNRKVFDEQLERRKAKLAKLLGRTQAALRRDITRIIEVADATVADDTMAEVAKRLDKQFWNVARNTRLQ